MEEIVKNYFKYVNDEKLDELFDLFDPDVDFKSPTLNVKGLENIKPFYFSVPKFYDEHVDDPLEINISGNKAATFIEFTGKTKKGADVHMFASDWFKIVNGKIKSLHIIFDSAYLSKALAGG
jgi:hypothetical protein